MRWFTSDTHFFHKNIMKPEFCDRPYRNVDEMNRDLIERWNAKVKKGHEINVLGDFAITGSIAKQKSILDQLNGRKRLWEGNHDMSARRMLDAGFSAVYFNTLEMYPDAIRVFLSHYPFRPEPDEAVDQRYLHKRIVDDGSWLLHGHVHKSWKQRGRMINVGVDVWDLAPVHIDQLMEIIEGGT